MSKKAFYFEPWVYSANKRKVDVIHTVETPNSIRQFCSKSNVEIYPLTKYRAKRFLVMWNYAHKHNLPIPNGAKLLYQIFYDKFCQAYIQDNI